MDESIKVSTKGRGPNAPIKALSDAGEGNDVDNGTKLRRALGLTATIESNSQSVDLPDPYAESCLGENCDPNSLVKLAQHTFKKLASKAGTKKWSPTPIQLQSWPILRSESNKTSSSDSKNANLIAIATTGSGKTLSYAVPMIDSCSLVRGKKSRRYVHGLVIVPTRELALQVSKVLKAVTKSANKLSGKTDKIVALAIYGGVNREEQIDLLSKNSQYILAATPLRLIDLLGIGEKDGNGNPSVPNESIQRLFESTRYLVIDEADQMATKSDMSQQVDLILDFLRNKSTHLDQQCLFSATLPKRAITKCNDWIEFPRVTVKVDTVTVGEAVAKEKGASDSGGKANKTADRAGPLDLSTIPSHITQTLHVCANHKKPKKLMTTINKIRKEEKEKGNRRRRGLLIIFFGRIKTLQCKSFMVTNAQYVIHDIVFCIGQNPHVAYFPPSDVHGLLQKDQIQAVALHSQMNQQKREAQLNLFRSGKCPILLATDVAARGIHIKNVEYVINYDFPGSLEQVCCQMMPDTSLDCLCVIPNTMFAFLVVTKNCNKKYVHRCGRAGRSKVSGRAGENKTDETTNASVYSFFHRELAPMASDMIDLLRSCNAWVDPNLIALVPGGTKQGDGESKRKRRKRDKNKGATADTMENKVPAPKKAKTSNAADNIGSDMEDEFHDLAPNRIVLKRASHVALSDSDSD